MMRLSFSPLVLATVVGFSVGFSVLAPAAQAAPVRGTVSLPSDVKVPRRFVGHWRVDYASVPGQSGIPAGTLVVVQGAKGQAPTAKTVSVEISGLQANPPSLVVSEGTVVEIRNSDKVTHELSIPGQPDVMPTEMLRSGMVRKQRFGTAGEYVIRCSQYPHVTLSVLVTPSPYFDTVDEKGGFKLDVPVGKAKLKVWSGGRWVHEQEIDVTEKGLELSVKVASASNKEPTE
jgi:plastocyanin